MRYARPTLIAMMFAVVLAFTAIVGRAAPTVEAATPPPIAATLVSVFQTSYQGSVPFLIPVTTVTGGYQVRRDIDDLRTVGFNDKAIAVLVTTASAVAVYSDINYQGTCETLFGLKQIDLTNTMIGKNSISSIKINATCLGATTGKPVVTDVSTIAGDTGNLRCPNFYTRINQDLNQSVSGKFIYLCVRYGPNNSATYIRDLRVVGPYTGKTCCDPDFAPVSLACQQPPDGSDTLLPQDLNEGVPGYGFVFLCMSRVTDSSSSRRTPLRDIGAFTVKTKDMITLTLDGFCPGTLRGVPASSTDRETTNINDPGVFGGLPTLSIFLCKSTYDGDGKASPAGSTTAPTITTSAVTVPPNCGVYCVPQLVASGSTITTAGPVTVTFTCKDASGTTLPMIPIAQNTFSATTTSGSITSMCVDAWGNEASATFSFTRRV